MVKLTGDQTVDGTKTFVQSIESQPDSVDQFDVSSTDIFNPDNYTVGALNGQDGWTADAAYDVFDSSGVNVIRLSTASSLNNASAARSLPVAADTSYHFRLFFPGGVYTNTVALRLQNGSTDVLRFNFTGDGVGGVNPSMEVAGAGTAQPWDQPIIAGVWYDMVVTVLQSQNTMRVYIKSDSDANYQAVTIAGFPESGWQLANTLDVNVVRIITWANVSGFQDLLHVGPLREFDQIVPLPLVSRWIDFRDSVGNRLFDAGYDSGDEIAYFTGSFAGDELFRINWGAAGSQLVLNSAPDTSGLVLNKTSGDGFQSIEFQDDGFPVWDFFQDRGFVGPTLTRGFGLYSLQLDHTFLYVNTTGNISLSPWTVGGGRIRLEGLSDVEGTLRLSALTGNRPLWLNTDNDVEAVDIPDFVDLLGLGDKADTDGSNITEEFKEIIEDIGNTRVVPAGKILVIRENTVYTTSNLVLDGDIVQEPGSILIEL